MNVRKNIFAELSRADFVTCFAILLVVNAFWVAWKGHYFVAISLTFVSMYLDYLDGWLARKYGGSDYGKVLDSLYDIVGWVLFPALMINIFTGWKWYSIVITSVFCVFAALRLSRFTVTGYVENGNRNFIGMPVSYSRYPLLAVSLTGGTLSLMMIACMIPLMVSRTLFKKSPPVLMQINLLYAVIYLWLHLTQN